MKELYSDRASEYAEAIQTNIYNSLYDKPALLSLIKERQYLDCLDMGCGPGAYIDELQKFCKKITAVDLNPNFIEMVSSKYPRIKFYVQNLDKGLEQEKDQSFDLVVSPLTVHYPFIV